MNKLMRYITNKWLRFRPYLTHSRISRRLQGLVEHWPEAIIAPFHYWRFLKMPLHKTAVLVEGNPFHAEILPAYSHYLQGLGYRVILLCRYKNYQSDVFCRTLNPPEKFCLSLPWMRRFLKKKSSECDIILFTSHKIFAEDIRFYGNFSGYLGFLPAAKKGCFFVEHSFFQKPDFSLSDAERIFLLTERTYNGIQIAALNPCYFGESHPRTLILPDKRIFITIGAVTEKNRNFSTLTQTVKNLNAKGLVGEFEVWVLGQVKQQVILDHLPVNMKIFGRVSFEKMYALLEKANFLLPCLEPNSESQRRYLYGITSGSRQLVLGFHIPPVIHRDFAKSYGFSEESAILYADGMLEDGMQRAIHLTSQYYAEKVYQLIANQKNVLQQSMKNLEQKIQPIEPF